MFSHCDRRLFCVRCVNHLKVELNDLLPNTLDLREGLLLCLLYKLGFSFKPLLLIPCQQRSIKQINYIRYEQRQIWTEGVPTVQEG